MTDEKRPNPEALLAQIQAQEERGQSGHLKIFIGAAPGVGKTYSMLEEAVAKKAEGIDVVIGIVETHGRSDTAKMLTGFEVLPKKQIEYKGQVLQEFDLDGAIARTPQLILVDEMAHTNAPNCRHTKRWQDIQELLDRGINVYTTLNVQHIESLNDVVHQITSIKVRETVPDSMLEEAEAIELVDLPPEDLLQRLAEGKVYFPEQAKIATKNFFKRSNLIALRELALRATAEQVNQEVLTERKYQSQKKIWATNDKLLICVGPGERSTKLVRSAKRLATKLQAEWLALYVDAPKLKLSDAERESAIQNLRLAEQLGAEVIQAGGDDLVEEILSVARERNVNKIIISKHVRPRWQTLFTGSLVDQLVRHSGDIDVYVIRSEEEEGGNEYAKKIGKKYEKKPVWSAYLSALFVVALCTGVDFLMYPHFALSDLIMVYLLGLVIVAGFGRHGPSLVASIVSVVALDFFFVAPSEKGNNQQYFFTFLVMLLIGVIISHLTIKIRQQAERARIREKRTYAILALTRQLANHRGVEELLQVATQQVAEVFDSEVLAMLPMEGKLTIKAGFNANWELTEKEMSVAKWCFDMSQMAGLGTHTLPYSDALYIPLLGVQGAVGVFRIKPKFPKRLLSEQMDLLQAFVDQTALALEVERLQAQALTLAKG